MTLYVLFDLGLPSGSLLAHFQEGFGLDLSSQLLALWRAGFLEVVWMIWLNLNTVRHGAVVQSNSVMVCRVCLTMTKVSLLQAGHMCNSLVELHVLR